jgi:uncharacterized protein
MPLPARPETIRRLIDEHRVNATPISPGPRHWQIFTVLCESAGARGDLIPDGYLAALAIESGSEWVTADRDFGRFPDLRWKLVDLR